MPVRTKTNSGLIALETWQVIFDAIGDAVWILDENYRITKCNLATERLLGLKQSDIVGRKCWEIMHNCRAPHPQCPVTRLRESKHRESMEIAISDRIYSVVADPIFDEQKNIARIIHIVSDITELKRAEELSRKFSWDILEAQELERKRLARDLHDGVNQVLSTVCSRLYGSMETHPGIDLSVRKELRRCIKLIHLGQEELRNMALNLSPPVLDDLGLLPACRNFCRDFEARTSISVYLELQPSASGLSSQTNLHLYRIIQECFANIEKHAHASRARLSLRSWRDSIVLDISDNGCGLRSSSLSHQGSRTGMGIPNIKQRAAILKGSVQIQPAPSGGFRVQVRVPRTNATKAQ